MFTLQFETENAAFADGNAPDEIARILRQAAERVASGTCDGFLMDANGNKVGTFAWSGLDGEVP